jgi:HD-GYP domain-containing protein (c-di-GMP phosphodiesterase class II)
MKRSLYVGKNDWEMLKNLFNAHYTRKFKLDQATLIKEVIDKLCSTGAYDIYLIDCDEKDIEPVQLWQDIVELAGEGPVIFIGSPNILATRFNPEERKLLVDAQFLERPVKIEAFKSTIDECIEVLEAFKVEHNTVEGNEEDFLPVKIRNFYLQHKIEFDAYAKIMPGKFLKVINRDHRYTITYLQSYLKKGVKCLYLKKDERLKLMDQSATQAQVMLAMPDLNLKKALTIQSVGVGIVHEYMRIMGPSNAAVDLTNALMDNVRRFSKQGSELREVFEHYDQSNKTIEGRSILTAFVADAMALQQGWGAEMLRKKLSLAAILHDCTLQDDQVSLVLHHSDPILQNMNSKDRDHYLNHPLEAAKFAAQFSEVSEVDFIIAQHHENAQGEGFPRKMSSLQVTALSATFALAVQFVTLLVQVGFSEPSLKKILARLRHESGGGNYRNALKSLEEALTAIP